MLMKRGRGGTKYKSGRARNELIASAYFSSSGPTYFHADLEGALTIVIQVHSLGPCRGRQLLA